MSVSTEATENSDERFRRIRTLIWVYFWLLIFEGALRKWILPQWSNLLLVVRDPLVVLLYVVALYEGIFPRNGFMWWSALLAIGNTIASGLVGQYNAVILLYGLRTCFLHLPLIFLIPAVFTLSDVEKLGRWLLILALPMAALVVLQFKSPADSWVNLSVTGEATQLTMGFDKIRPPGTFSFTNGLGSFIGLVVAFLLANQIKTSSINPKLVLAATPAAGIMIATSGSRGTLSSVVLIVLGLGYVCLRKPVFFGRGLRTLFILGAAFLALQLRPEFRQGLEIFQERISTGGGVRNGLIVRQMQDFLTPFAAAAQTPALGYGTGLGTTVASQLLWGKRRLVFSEGEWERIIRESGPYLGFGYLGMRVAILVLLFLAASRALSEDNPLPMLIFASIFPNALSGQWGMPTALGFATFGAGICLAAANRPRVQIGPTLFHISPGSVTNPTRTVRGRSIYSEKLHGR